MPFIIGYELLLSSAIPPRQRDDMETSQVPSAYVRAWVLRHRGIPSHIGGSDAPSTNDKASASRTIKFSVLNSPHAPLSTLNPRPRERVPMTRGGSGGSPSPSRRTCTGCTHQLAWRTPLFYAGCIKRPMAGRFAPPPIVRAYARRLLVLRTMQRHGASRHRRTRALTRHASDPPCNFIVRTPQTTMTDRRSPNAASLLANHMRRHSAQNGSLPSSDTMALAASATFLPGNTPLSRNVRRLRSVISMPPDFNTSCI